MAKVARFTQDNQNPVGMIVQSMLTEAQFQAINGTNWVLADGRSVTGSLYASATFSNTIPDLRGMVLRGKNNGRTDGNENPDGESTLGAFQNEGFKAHNHDDPYTDPLSNTTIYQLRVAQPSISVTNANFTAHNLGNGLPYAERVMTSTAAALSNVGGNETRMKNITVNFFIKIN